MHALSPDLPQSPGQQPPRADGAVLCWIVPPVVRALEGAVAALGGSNLDPAALEGARRALREARGALVVARVAGAPQLLAAAEALLAQPDPAGHDALALFSQACAAVRDYVSGLCAGLPQRPRALLGVLRPLLARHGAASDAGLEDFFHGGGPAEDAAPLGAEAAARARAQHERLRRLAELWERCAAGDADACAPFAAALNELLAEGLPHALLTRLAAQVQHGVAQVHAQAPDAALALAVAIALLFLQDALAAWPEANAMLERQVDALVRRLERPAAPGEARSAGVDLQQDAQRREQARALAGRLSAELVGLVRSAQHHVQAFFEDGAAPETLARAHAALLQTQRVLTLMADGAAARAALYCAERIADWQAAGGASDADTRGAVVATLCGLEYYIEQLAFGDGDLPAILRRAGVPDAVHAGPAGDAREAEVSAQPGDPAAAAQSGAAQPAAQSATMGPVDTPSDADMLQIFLEEASEVLATLRGELDALRENAGSQERLGVVRRAYHTLKGSGRMVGLTHLGEAAWALEQALNAVLQRSASASPDLMRLLELAQERFGHWIERLGRDGRVGVDAGVLAQWSEHIRRGDPLPAEHSPAQAPALADAEAAPVTALVPERTVDIGSARVSPDLFAIFVAEAAQHVATLRAELEALARSRDGVASYESFRAAHTLAGIAGTTGFAPLSELAGELERVLQRLHQRPRRLPEADIARVMDAWSALDTMVRAVARLNAPAPASALAAGLAGDADRLLTEAGERPHIAAEDAAAAALADAQPSAPHVAPEAEEPPASAHEYAQAEAGAERRRGRITDDLDRDLLPVFLEEAADLVPQIGQLLRDWRARPDDVQPPQALKRLLHTLKGSARMAGAMALGELTHSVETRVADAAERGAIPERVFDSLYVSFDRMGVLLEQLERGETDPARAPAESVAAEPAPAAAPALLRVRAELVDRLVDEAGEVSIARSRMEVDLRTMRAALRDLTESVIRLRTQVREVEIQAETQLESRLAQARQAEEQFDPLEFDRFTRLQELTRFLAESISDVAALQQNILESADNLEATLGAQRRTARAVQDGLMRVRLIPVATLTERLHRVARLTAREAGRRVNLEIHGGRVELDRGVMERIAGPLEHLLRNAVVHGIESGERRSAAGKPETGSVRLAVRQEGNEVVLSLGDDGQGLDLPRIRAHALAAGLIDAPEAVTDSEAAQLIFAPGLSTSEQLTEAAGRGVGLDVVRTEIGSLGGRVQVDFTPGRGTTFTIYLPVTLSVMQAVLVSSGGQAFALPTPMVEQVQKVKAEALAQLFEAGAVHWQGEAYPLHDLQELLGDAGHALAARRYHSLVLLRSGALRAAVHVDDLLGSQEIVVKNIGAQLARVAGIAGAAVLGSGDSVLILNPIVLTQALAATPGGASRVATRAQVPVEPARPTVMVVDDSLTIRRITARLLARAGYEVLEARDGVDALEKLRNAVPSVLLLDIEMPRMDGFELTERLRDDPRLRHIPIIVISSRTADKHRQHAARLGVNLFLGKPYQEDELLGHIAAFVAGAPDTALPA